MGRPLGALKGRTEQANEFALWLRRVTSGIRVRSLEEDFPYGKSSWSSFRDGSRLPPQELVEEVAARYLPEPVMRSRQLREGLRLLSAAQQAVKALDGVANLPVAAPGPNRADAVAAALLRLDDARLRQIEAMQKLAASEKRREQLEDMVSALQERCTLLESERDLARKEVQAELQHELQLSLEYRRQADEKLDQARRAEEKAYSLRLAAEKQVAVERMALRHIDPNTFGNDAKARSSNLSPVKELNLPPLEQIHRLLEAAQQQLDAQDQELDDLGLQIGLDAESNYGEVTLTRIVQTDTLERGPAGAVHDTAADHGLDNTGKALTRQDAAVPISSAHGWDALAESRTGTHRDNLPSQTGELLSGLEGVKTPTALSDALSLLLQREGRQPLGKLTPTAFPGHLKDDLVYMTVMRWIDDDVLPDTWNHLESLVRVMGATDHEVSAFERAYARILAGYPSELGMSRDLADLSPRPFRSRLVRGRYQLLSHSRTWFYALAGPSAIALVTTGFTAGLQNSSTVSPWRLLGYGTLVVLICVFAMLLSVGMAMPTPPKRTQGTRAADFGLRLCLLAFPAGLAVPWAISSDVLGRWLADLTGML